MFNLIESCFGKLKNYVRRKPKNKNDTVINLVQEAKTSTSASDYTGWTLYCIGSLSICLKGKNVSLNNGNKILFF
jgi:hypothetical protein